MSTEGAGMSPLFSLQTYSEIDTGTGDLVKCTRCPTRLAQEAFPRQRNLKYLKTCVTCTQNLAISRESQRQRRQDLPPPSPQQIRQTSSSPRKGPEARGTETRMQLEWNTFIGLVATHKTVAFELDAEVILHGLQTEITSFTSKEVANEIASKVWNATEYRFMWVSLRTWWGFIQFVNYSITAIKNQLKAGHPVQYKNIPFTVHRYGEKKQKFGCMMSPRRDGPAPRWTALNAMAIFM